MDHRTVSIDRPRGLRHDFLPLTPQEREAYLVGVNSRRSDPEARDLDLVLEGLRKVLSLRGLEYMTLVQVYALLWKPYCEDNPDDPDLQLVRLCYCLQDATFGLSQHDEERLHRLSKEVEDIKLPKEPTQAEAEDFLAGEIKRAYPKLKRNSKEYKRLWEAHIEPARKVLLKREGERCAEALKELPKLLERAGKLAGQSLKDTDFRQAATLACFGTGTGADAMRSSIAKETERFQSLSRSICRRLEAFSAFLEANPLPKPNCKGCKHLEGEYVGIVPLVRWWCVRGEKRLVKQTRELVEHSEEKGGGATAETPDRPADCPGFEQKPTTCWGCRNLYWSYDEATDERLSWHCRRSSRILASINGVFIHPSSKEEARLHLPTPAIPEDCPGHED